MPNIQALIHSSEAPKTLIMMSGDQLAKLIDDVTNYTRKVVEEQYQPKYYTVDDIMKLFSVQRSTVYNWIKNGRLVAYYMEDGGRPYFEQAEVREHMRQGKLGKYQHR